MSDEHIAMIEEIRLLKKVTREREISDERDALLVSSRLRSAGGTGAAPKVSVSYDIRAGCPNRHVPQNFLVSPCHPRQNSVAKRRFS